MADELEIDPRFFQNPTVNAKAPDHKTIYSNVIRTGVSPFDIRLVFGQVVDAVPGNFVPHTEDLATIILAAEEAKALIPVLQQAVQRYEEMYGAIRDITSVLTRMKEQALAKAAAQPETAATPAKSGTPRKPKKH